MEPDEPVGPAEPDRTGTKWFLPYRRPKVKDDPTMLEGEREGAEGCRSRTCHAERDSFRRDSSRAAPGNRVRISPVLAHRLLPFIFRVLNFIPLQTKFDLSRKM